MNDFVYETVTSTHLNYHQKLAALCHAAEDTLDVLEIPEKFCYYQRHERRPCSVPSPVCDGGF